MTNRSIVDLGRVRAALEHKHLVGIRDDRQAETKPKSGTGKTGNVKVAPAKIGQPKVGQRKEPAW